MSGEQARRIFEIAARGHSRSVPLFFDVIYARLKLKPLHLTPKLGVRLLAAELAKGLRVDVNAPPFEGGCGRPILTVAS
jgi:hypothetical protein